MKKAAIYARVSTPDQHVETQLYDLRKLAEQRGFTVSSEYCDRGISGSKARRPGLDAMLSDARPGRILRPWSRPSTGSLGVPRTSLKS